jgi:hypothetical protein
LRIFSIEFPEGSIDLAEDLARDVVDLARDTECGLHPRAN